MRMLAAVLLLLGGVFSTYPKPVASQDRTECEAGFRLVEHALGSSCIPEQPQRVVALDTAINELMLILEIEPVVASDIVVQTYSRMHPELVDTYSETTEDLPDMGFPPNVEVILGADPDLIIAPDDIFSRAIYDQLVNTIPMVVYEVQPGQWRERLVLAGDLLNVTEEVDLLLADYDARVLELQTLIDERNVNAEVSLVRTFPNQVGLVVNGTMAHSVLEEVGLSRPESQDITLDYVLEELNGRPEILINEEELRLADGDVIFVFGDADELLENPLWNTLSAVRDDRAYVVGYYWWGDSLLSAHDMLDDLFEYVVMTEPKHVNPFETGIPAVSPLTDETE